MNYEKSTGILSAVRCFFSSLFASNSMWHLHGFGEIKIVSVPASVFTESLCCIFSNTGTQIQMFTESYINTISLKT